MKDESDLTKIKARFDAWVERRVVIPEDDEMSAYGGRELSEEERTLRENQKRWDKLSVKLCDQLQLCTDPMPPEICEEFDLPPEATYAQAIRLIDRDPQRQRPPWESMPFSVENG